MKPKIIAFYLPQFHPIPENDAWWGKGFTEWTNVKKAKSLFWGHEQPKVPADLGYYDLRIPVVRQQQAKMAKEAGIDAFCYWHYWFGGGKKLLELPFNEVVSSGEPDFPFCLAWANHDWIMKTWNSDVPRSDSRILIKQDYPGEQDYINHFYNNLNAFQDKRYVRIEGKPFFLVYSPQDLPDAAQFIAVWNALAQKHNIRGFYFVAHARNTNNIRSYLDMGFDAVNFSPHRMPFRRMKTVYHKIRRKIFRLPHIVHYAKAIKIFDDPVNAEARVIPTVIPNWDHTPRSGVNGVVMHKSNPELFRNHVNKVVC